MAFLLRDHGRQKRRRADAHWPATTDGPGATIFLPMATTDDALTTKGGVGTELPPAGDTDRTRAEALYGSASPVEVAGTNISLTNKQSSCVH
jgi:hypothetical protein